MNFRRSAFVLALLVPLAAPAAGTWHADNRGSTFTFSGTAQGEAFNGQFKIFEATISFDPAQLVQSHIDVKVTLDSADTANAERDDTLRGRDFFDAKRSPLATYSATKVRSLGGNRYAADGLLYLHGVVKPTTISFAWNGGATPAMVVDAVLNRLDFNIGAGQWADTSQIGNAVKVHAALKLTPVAAKK